MEGFIKYFKNTGWLFLSRVFGMAIGFIVTVVVIRYLGPIHNGALNYAISIVGLFSFIAALGLDQVLYRDLIKYPEREGQLLSTAIILRFWAGLLATLITVVVGYFLSLDRLTFFAILIAALSFLFQPLTVINYAFQARVHSHFSALSSMMVLLILAILKLIVIHFDRGVYWLSAIYAVEPLLYGIFYLLFVKKNYHIHFDWTFNKSAAWEMVRESLPLMLAVVFTSIYYRIDQVLLGQMIDIKAVGIYDPAVRLSEVWYFVPAILTGSLFPALINAQKTAERIYARRLIWLLALLISVSVIISLGVTFSAKFLMSVIFGGEFVNGYKVLQLYVWSGIGISLALLSQQYLVAEKMVKVILYSSIIGMLLNIGLNLLLIPRYGINGSALATLISYTLGPLSILLFRPVRARIISLVKLAI